jgi:hypothetical protein
MMMGKKQNTGLFHSFPIKKIILLHGWMEEMPHRKEKAAIVKGTRAR